MANFNLKSLKKTGLSSLFLRILGSALTVLYVLFDNLGAGEISYPNLACWPAMLIFTFLLAEGIMHTQDFWAYFLRLLIFASLAEPFYDRLNSGYWIDTSGQNILFSLLLAFCLLYAINQIRISTGNLAATLISEICLASLGCKLAEFINLEMGVFTVLSAIFCYISLRVHYKGLFRLISIAILSFSLGMDLMFSLYVKEMPIFLPMPVAALLALPFIHFYKGKHGANPLWLRYASYLFYPLLLIVVLILHNKGIRL